MAEPSSNIWHEISERVKAGDSIPNWTVLKGYMGDTMNVVQIDENKIIIQTPNSKHLINVSRNEFEKVWKVWPAYKVGSIKRQEIREMTFYSKYIISIFHLLEKN